MSLLLWLTLVGYLLVRRYAGTSGERIAAGERITLLDKLEGR